MKDEKERKDPSDYHLIFRDSFTTSCSIDLEHLFSLLQQETPQLLTYLIKKSPCFPCGFPQVESGDDAYLHT